MKKIIIVSFLVFQFVQFFMCPTAFSDTTNSNAAKEQEYKLRYEKEKGYYDYKNKRQLEESRRRSLELDKEDELADRKRYPDFYKNK